MPELTVSAARLYSLIGDGMHDLPVEVIEKLERMLQRYGMQHPADEPEWWDAGGYPRSALDIACYLDACIVESGGDPKTVAEALLAVADANDLRRIARACGLPCDVLRRQLSGRRTLSFGTVLGAMRALGVQLRVHAGAR
ncbi:DNA-binding protein [Stenotrophomonas tumulicola]|uniref:Uncharacterized protein n=1 Tax=Stenotrophomonas tumulicola TaxID=1685415 RepID=A0A7W3IJN9_9GAMM|nr:hypothetical protein [Stenotrophomonas tumulicola]MBA8682849.1 hypothetical protein [Stenotrophomonas tumulicola]